MVASMMVKDPWGRAMTVHRLLSGLPTHSHRVEASMMVGKHQKRPWGKAMTIDRLCLTH